MSMWDGVNDAEVFERGKFMTSGFSGVVEVLRTIGKKTRASGLAFIVELRIVETNMPEEHPVDQKGTWFQGMTDPNVAFPAVAAWAAACLGIEIHNKAAIKAEVMPTLADTMTHATDNPDANPFIGCKLKLDCVGIVTQKGNDFTRYDFSPYSG